MGTLVVGLVLAAVVAAALHSILKNKRSGKSSCGGNCAHCASGGGCHGAALKNDFFTTIAEIDGMMCGMCETHINDAVRAAFDVKKVKSSFKTGFCQILSKTPLDSEKLRLAIEKTGYRVKDIIQK